MGAICASRRGGPDVGRRVGARWLSTITEDSPRSIGAFPTRPDSEAGDADGAQARYLSGVVAQPIAGVPGPGYAKPGRPSIPVNLIA